MKRKVTSLCIFNALSLKCVSDLKHLKLISSVGVQSVPSSPEPGMSYFFLSSWLMESHRSPNITSYHQCSWLPSRNWQWDPTAEDTTYLNHRALKNQVGTDPEVSALLKRAIHQNILTQMWILWVTVMTCQAWHAHWSNSATNVRE